MKKKLISVLATGLFFLGMVGAAQAVVVQPTYYFSFEGSSFTKPAQVYDSLTMSVNGVGVEITAWQIDGDDGTITSKTSIANAVHSSYTGIGVFADGDADINGSSVGGYDEGLLFSFNRTVRLDRLNMGSFGSNDDVNLHVDGINVFYDERGNDPGHDDHFDFAPGDYGTAVGTQFLIWADGSSDEFQIDGMLVSAVPVPAAAWLLFSGLIGLVGLKRKKE